MGYNNQLQGRFGADIYTAQEWRNFIAGGRGMLTRKTANNTYVHAGYGDDNAVAIRLHDTNIVIVNNDGTMILNSGGWLSSTTKERINRYTNAGISQRNSVWYMRDGSLFYDGMTINFDGTPVKPKQPEKYEKQLKAIKKQAKQYASDFVKELKAGNIAMPSGGDCWGCAMRDDTGKTVMGAHHLRDHMSEKYYVPSLLVNAGREAGYQDFQIGMMGIGGQRLFIDPERNIYKYMVKHLQRELK